MPARRLAALAAAVVCLVTVSAVRPLPTRADPPTKPNIVVFYIDDMQPNDGRLWSDPNITPNLYDLFVAHGIHFNNAIGETPLCCPSRATLLTGLHTHNHGVTLNDASLFDPGETVAKELQKSGYDTMIVGKYLNKVYPFTPEQWVPHEAGWSSMDVFQNDQRLYPERYYYHYDIRQIGGTITHYDEPHSTRFVAETAVARLQAVPVDLPDFLLLTPYSTHAPDIPMPEFVGDPRCANMPPWDPPSYNEADISDKPVYVQKHAVNMPAAGYPLVQFCESMLGVDWMVGQVVAELTAEGRMDNTLFVFTADNGMTWGEHHLPLNKDTPYATPIPLYMYWASRWGNRPREVNEYVSDIDLAPTFCDAGGCTLGPYPTGQNKPDGVSILPLLDPGGATDLGRDALLQENFEVPWSGLRTTPENPVGLWHYVEWPNGDRELYDISADPWELQNRANDPSLADVQNALAQRLSELRVEGMPPSRPHAKPDAAISLTDAGPWRRLHFYRPVPVRKQTVARVGLTPDTTVDYVVRIANDGDKAGTFSVASTEKGDANYSVAYFAGTNDVTSAIDDGLYDVDLDPGASTMLTVQVTVGTAAPVGSSRRAILTVTSLDDATQVDVVRARAAR